MANGFPPNRESILLSFTQTFATALTANPTRYSCTAAQATAYSTLSTAFVNSYAVANAKATRSPLNIELKNASKTALLVNLRMLAKIIQNSPTTTNAMRLELGLPQRGATPTPVPAPGTPFKFKVSLDQTGALTLGWKCVNPKGASGTMYQVWRKIGPTGSYEYLGGSGKKDFIDDSIPAGTSQLTYKIQGVRSSVVGAFAQYTVSFGTGGGVMSVVEVPALKRAA